MKLISIVIFVCLLINTMTQDISVTVTDQYVNDGWFSAELRIYVEIENKSSISGNFDVFVYSDGKKIFSESVVIPGGSDVTIRFSTEWSTKSINSFGEKYTVKVKSGGIEVYDKDFNTPTQ
eukprot:TRINITY_DN47_c0_g1_i1.p2 TRINITY_DN47_c0_g1~~TRINITY_DN47_c0_g1_i1.p2  ORF type:complete len:121 (-),score=0.38 TRINITY_DN47_c0_g1_i1:363-725(-)